MAQNITLLGASYSAVPAVTLPKTGGGTASFTDVSDTTATAADVASGTYFYTAAGEYTEGTASGGGVEMITVTIILDTGFDKAFIDPRATMTLDPDTYNYILVTPKQSLLVLHCSLMPQDVTTTTGTYEWYTIPSRPSSYDYAFYLGETDGSITI